MDKAEVLVVLALVGVGRARLVALAHNKRMQLASATNDRPSQVVKGLPLQLTRRTLYEEKLNEENIVTQEEINQTEWENPDNWTGPKGLSIYFSKGDSRCFVPKQIRGLGPTMNLGRTSGFYWLFFGTLFLVAIAFIAGKYAT